MLGISKCIWQWYFFHSLIFSGDDILNAFGFFFSLHLIFFIRVRCSIFFGSNKKKRIFIVTIKIRSDIYLFFPPLVSAIFEEVKNCRIELCVLLHWFISLNKEKTNGKNHISESFIFFFLSVHVLARFNRFLMQREESFAWVAKYFFVCCCCCCYWCQWIDSFTRHRKQQRPFGCVYVFFFLTCKYFSKASTLTKENKEKNCVV